MTNQWTVTAVSEVAAEPQRIVVLFPAAGRAVGRAPIDPVADPLGVRHGTVDDRARAELVCALLAALPAAPAAAQLADLYRYGDDAERRGVLCGLNESSNVPPDVAAVGVELVADALRTNDPRLVAAALGPFAVGHLDQHGWRHGVLKALFMGIPLDVVADLERRADPELARMAAALITERQAAGRTVSDDMTRLATITTTTTTPGG
ncbi:EboA domain-containing protein [Agromyces ramosus]|uniref:Sugar phosphate isomerase n=1 Tax=Agromyces ramosus TaxID=33879 RepID=A0ABU0RB41_9MICO|nr:EboA domain-containing protein [Agromyces ramosus]MDQ0894234.1 hypothetical protein [Agromyces ramosus]